MKNEKIRSWLKRKAYSEMTWSDILLLMIAIVAVTVCNICKIDLLSHPFIATSCALGISMIMAALRWRSSKN